MRNLLTGLATLLTVFCAGHQAEAEEHQEDVWQECRPENTCTIEYDRLSNQQTDPFMFEGLVLDGSSSRWGRYRRAINEFGSVQDCLVPNEQASTNPNLLLIDWERVRFDKNADVCVFRIARSLGDVDRLVGWFEFHGFKVTEIPDPSGQANQEKPNHPITTFGAKWEEREYKDRESLAYRLFFKFYRVNGLAFNIRLSASNQVVTVETHWF